MPCLAALSLQSPILWPVRQSSVRIDQLLNIFRFQALRHFIRHSATKIIALPGARWQITAYHAVAQLTVK
jgi:hypothetical protein